MYNNILIFLVVITGAAFLLNFFSGHEGFKGAGDDDGCPCGEMIENFLSR